MELILSSGFRILCTCQKRWNNPLETQAASAKAPKATTSGLLITVPRAYPLGATTDVDSLQRRDAEPPVRARRRERVAARLAVELGGRWKLRGRLDLAAGHSTSGDLPAERNPM